MSESISFSISRCRSILKFRDEAGQGSRSSGVLHAASLSFCHLVYYHCPMLCTHDTRGARALAAWDVAER